MKKRIFITGESGTIPTAIQWQARYYDQNFEVMNCQLDDKHNLKPLKTHQSFSIREPEINFLDRDLLFKEITPTFWKEVDVIIHSGAFVGTDFCQLDPQGTIQTNIEGTKNVVDLCNKYDIDLVYFSTTAIFDPKDYSMNRVMTEQTKIDPQTLYGITKYTGEQIVQKLCKTKKMIIRPVFGFGDYPDDLHSALTKIIYALYYNYYVEPTKIDILLDKQITKSYIRVENIAKIVLGLIKYDTWFETFNVGESYHNSLNWFELFKKIKFQYSKFIDDEKFLNSISDENKSIKFFPNEDYLHYHNMCDVKLRTTKLSTDMIDDYIDIDEGIFKTCKSVINNINKKPYWI